MDELSFQQLIELNQEGDQHQSDQQSDADDDLALFGESDGDEEKRVIRFDDDIDALKENKKKLMKLSEI